MKLTWVFVLCCITTRMICNGESKREEKKSPDTRSPVAEEKRYTLTSGIRYKKSPDTRSPVAEEKRYLTYKRSPDTRSPVAEEKRYLTGGIRYKKSPDTRSPGI
ncbi:hypothetical protein V1264_012848 [Littorina saxatilis]|uniref:Uncharacterized protein n=1 Tax=Littorina saxatilis TaxID=31220 RepID=A0AAN9BXE1_9CAEN